MKKFLVMLFTAAVAMSLFAPPAQAKTRKHRRHRRHHKHTTAQTQTPPPAPKQ
jgi:hypothetical protein